MWGPGGGMGEGWAALGPRVLPGCSPVPGLQAVERVVEAGVQLPLQDKIDGVLREQSAEELQEAAEAAEVKGVPTIRHPVQHPGPTPGAEEDLGGRRGGSILSAGPGPCCAPRTGMPAQLRGPQQPSHRREGTGCWREGSLQGTEGLAQCPLGSE